eukprot:GHUV01020824.1.p1 GENE.GHUV01020824.1~~GHUV01020824.1.p1  ORF type:complete len:342 (+),score=105.43 GHUV01020824.1:533-1558(+)
MAEAFEPPPVMYTLASAVSLFKDEAPPSSGAIDDVDMTIDDATDSTQQSQQQAPAAARTRRRWEVEEDQEHHQSAADHKQQQDSTQPAPAAAGSAREVQRGGSSSPEGVGHEPGDGTANSSRPVKKARFSGQLDSTSNGLDIDHEALLAGVNQVLEQLDAGGATANGFHDLSDDVGRGPRAAGASSMSLGASYNSQGSKGGILKGSSTSGSVKKKVTWPDLPMEEDQQATGFRIAPIQRQVRHQHWGAGYIAAAASAAARVAVVLLSSLPCVCPVLYWYSVSTRMSLLTLMKQQWICQLAAICLKSFQLTLLHLLLCVWDLVFAPGICCLSSWCCYLLGMM